jgi:hypothetical protein
MDESLRQLIDQYRSAVRHAIHLMLGAGIRLPETNMRWVSQQIPSPYPLAGEGVLRKHGFGCEVRWSGGSVDFDFGENGEVDGFDEWRLWKYCQSNTYGSMFSTEADLKAAVQEAVNEKLIRQKGRLLFLETT